MSANDRQPGGDHYKRHGDFQPWDAWWHWKLNAFQSNILKYIVRYREKGGLQDLEKAKHYLEKLIELETAERESKRAEAERSGDSHIIWQAKTRVPTGGPAKAGD